MHRRDFIGSLAAAGIVPAASRRLSPLGLQLYTVRELMQRDFTGTLRAVRAAGYREVEFAGYFGRTPREVQLALREARLTAPAVHVDATALFSGFDEVLERSRATGHQWVVVAWMPDEMRRTLDDWRRAAELFNQCAELARRHGLGFAYHNHDYAFRPTEGAIPYDVLLENTNPGLVKMELDLFWIRKGGQDPLAYFERWPERFPMVHVKEMTADGQMVDVGQGVIDFRSIFAQARRAGIQHYFVEHDEPVDPLASIRNSYRYLRRL